MKISEIPGLTDYLKRLPQMWLDDPEEWTMENWYMVKADGKVLPLPKNYQDSMRQVLDLLPGTKAKKVLADAISGAAKQAGGVALIQCCEGWIAVLEKKHHDSGVDVMDVYGPEAEAAAKRKELGVARRYALIINAQTAEETYLQATAIAGGHPKVLGKVLQETKATEQADGIFQNLLK